MAVRTPAWTRWKSLAKALEITLPELMVYHLEATTVNRLLEELRQELGLTESEQPPVISG